MLYNKNKTIKIPSQETSCEMEEIKKFLPIKIAENAEQIEMIEFFLPMECFDWRVDLWEVEEEPIFFYRSLVIRSLERNYLNHHKLAAKYWKEKWNACYTELTYSNTYVADEKLDKTKMIEKNVVGGIFCSTNDFCKTVKTTLITGIPIALYTQSEKLSLQNVLNELEGGTFHNLPIKIQKLKIQNREAWKDVILLWDNPLQRPGEHNE